jgi:hypothetical protein
MRLVLKHYLSSLRERGELDAILPDLLSQMGLNVFSRPQKGTRQAGVDVGAVGTLAGEPEQVYLCSIKRGDLTRQEWDGGPQSLRPSLNEILDTYIPTRVPVEHREKPVTICIVIGGDVQEQVQTDFRGYIAYEESRRPNLTFKEWNGDKLAELIESSFLREDLLPQGARAELRKALALLEEPEAAYSHFARLVRALAQAGQDNEASALTSLRQMAVCVWIMLVWARDVGNLEAAYLSGELALLCGWKVASAHPDATGRVAGGMSEAFSSLLSAYHRASMDFLAVNVFPHADKLHAVSSAVRGSSPVDINLKLFDLLGRLGIAGAWAYYAAEQHPAGSDIKQQSLDLAEGIVGCAKNLIANNPVLLLPLKDDQAIDVTIACMLFSFDQSNHREVRSWLAEMLARATFAYQGDSTYPCAKTNYGDLLSHPKRGDDDYKKSVTMGSILYPMIALFAALLGDEDTYDGVTRLKAESMQHCNFQLWYPDEESESNFYTADDLHGAVLSDAGVSLPREAFLRQVFDECHETTYYEELSAARAGLWPLIMVACRHHRTPVPLQLLEPLRSLSSPEHETLTPTTPQDSSEARRQE